MAAAAAVLSHIYKISTVFFTILLLELLVSFRTLFKFLSLRFTSTSIAASHANIVQLIEDKLPSTIYNHKHSIPTLHSASDQAGAECCSVCLSRFKEGEMIRKLKCKHTFHKDCLDRWLEQEFAMATCPLCRREVLPKKLMGKLRQLSSSLVEMEDHQYDGRDEELISLLSVFHGTTSWHTLL